MLVAQTVKYLPATQETQGRPLGWEDPLEKGMLPTPVFLPEEFHRQRSLVGYSPRDHKESDTTERLIRTFPFRRNTVSAPQPPTPLSLIIIMLKII